MKASPWDGKIKDFKLEPASFSQMVHCLLVLVLVLVLLLVLVLVVRLGHHDGWMIAILLCPTFPLMTSTLTCYRFKCTSSVFCFPLRRLFLAHRRGVAWKDVGKYHSCIHKRRKSWSNKSFESLLQHVSMSDGQLVQHMFQCSILGS